MQTSNMISYDQIRQYFSRDSEFLVLLPSLLKALDWQGSLRILVENLPHFAETITLVELRNTMARLGFKSEQIDIEINNIPEPLFPVLYLPEQSAAFIILEKKEDNKYRIIKDQSGVETEVTLTNVPSTVYFFSAIKETPMTEIQRTTWFYEYLLQYKWLVGQALIISMIVNILLLSTPIYVMNVYNRVVPTGSIHMLFSFMAAVLFILIAINVLEIARIKILAYIGAKVDRAINNTLISTLLYLPTEYMDGTSLGNQLARLHSFEAIRDFFSSPLMIMTFEVPFILIFILVVWLLGGILVLVPIAMIGVFAFIYWVTMVYVQRASNTYGQLNSVRQALQLETLTNMRDIKAMGEEKLWLEKYKHSSASAVYAGYRASTLSAAMETISDSLMNLAGLVMLSVGTLYAMSGDLSLGALIAIMMLIWKILGPIKAFFSVLPKMQQFFTSIKQINSLAMIKTEKSLKREVTKMKQQQCKINFTRVSFRYRSELSPALLGVNFNIEPNELICLTGASGSGKSTIFKLIMSLYMPQAGNIFINDININQLDVFELRNYVAYLPQRSDLFYGTILQNILFACPTASKYDVEVATRLAGIYHEIIALPEKFNARIGDQVSNMYSPGFHKRLCLARTYLKKSNILLLDEPESNLDHAQAQTLEELVQYMHGKRTIIMATHRPSYMRIADRILYFKEGQLVYDDVPKEIFKKVSLSDL